MITDHLSLWVYIRSSVQKKFNHLNVSTPRGKVDWTFQSQVPAVDVSSSVQEDSHDVQVSKETGNVQGSQSCLWNVPEKFDC